MKAVELYARVRYAVQIEGLSERAAARRFGIDPRTVAKMMRFSVPPGYRRTKPPIKPKPASPPGGGEAPPDRLPREQRFVYLYRTVEQGLIASRTGTSPQTP